jgi:sirohydrochlorin ferrochelatase
MTGRGGKHMEAILVLAHGSKRKETEDTLHSIIEQVKEITGNGEVYPAFLQFSSCDIESSIDGLYKRGIRNISVVPLFIFDGVHVTVDIPEEMDRIASKYDGLKIAMKGHIGADSRLAQIVADRAASGASC